MKIFAIRDEELGDRDLAYLLYYEQSRSFYIEMPEDGNPWELPMLLSSFWQRGEYTVNAYWSLLWVQQRIVPTDRQNLGMILRENKLKGYDEYRLLLLGRGRCAQDNCYLVPMEEKDLPRFFFARQARRVSDVIPVKNNRLLVFFRDGRVSKYDVARLAEDKPALQPVINNEGIFTSVEVLPGGYGVHWGTQLTISDKQLYENGTESGMDLEDFKSFVRYRVVSAAEAAEILQCSRQNLNALVKRGSLHPVKAEGRVTLFFRNELSDRGRYQE